MAFSGGGFGKPGKGSATSYSSFAKDKMQKSTDRQTYNNVIGQKKTQNPSQSAMQSLIAQKKNHQNEDEEEGLDAVKRRKAALRRRLGIKGLASKKSGDRK